MRIRWVSVVMNAHGFLCFLPKFCGPRQRKSQDDRPVGKPSASYLLYLPSEHFLPLLTQLVPNPGGALVPGEESPISWGWGWGGLGIVPGSRWFLKKEVIS